MDFEWDENKNLYNIEKHGIDFADAALIFDAPILEYEDLRQDYGEQRFICIGMVENIELVVVYAKRKRIRLISARRASKDERQKYRSLYP